MHIFLFAIALMIGQMPTLSGQPVIHLSATAESIRTDYRGSTVELKNSRPVIYLPVNVPKSDASSESWYVDVKNLGPGDVTIKQTAQSASAGGGFTLILHAGDFARIRAVGSGYARVK
jgi:hypothetical protein